MHRTQTFCLDIRWQHNLDLPFVDGNCMAVTSSRRNPWNSSGGKTIACAFETGLLEFGVVHIPPM